MVFKQSKDGIPGLEESFEDDETVERLANELAGMAKILPGGNTILLVRT